MADMSAPPPGVTSPEGMRSPEEALFPREEPIFRIDLLSYRLGDDEENRILFPQQGGVAKD